MPDMLLLIAIDAVKTQNPIETKPKLEYPLLPIYVLGLASQASRLPAIFLERLILMPEKRLYKFGIIFSQT